MQVRVVACDVDHLAAALDDPQALSARVGAAIAPGLIEGEWREAFRFARDELARRPSELAGWWTALFVLDGPSVVCGMGGFKGPPGAAGVVEIGYSIAPPLRGRGLATLAAQELVRIAFADPRVRAVQAHTLAERNSSTRVLEKAGFRFVAEVIDPAEHPDPIWRWRLDR
ncbi:MAG: GNAT family N-acetyltransferase [Myxococcales bacterium]